MVDHVPLGNQVAPAHEVAFQGEPEHLVFGLDMHSADERRGVCAADDERQMDQAYLIHEPVVQHRPVQRRAPPSIIIRPTP